MEKYNWKGERLLPSAVDQGVFAYHIARYAFAHNFIKGKRVLDAACGAGYGSSYLAETALKVTGVDINEEAITFAQAQYATRQENLGFAKADIFHLPFPDEKYEAVVSFETLEHLKELTPYFEEIKRVAHPEADFFFSVPEKRTNHDAGLHNPFHFNELSLEDLKTCMEAHFTSCKYYVQLLPLAEELSASLMAKMKKKMPFQINLGISATLRKLKKSEEKGENVEDIALWLHDHQELVAKYPILPLAEVNIEDFTPGKTRLIFMTKATGKK